LASRGRGTCRYAARRRASCGGGHSPRAAHMTCGTRHTRTTKAGSAAAKPVHPRGRTVAVGFCFLATVPASARQQCSACTSPVMPHTVQRRARGDTAFTYTNVEYRTCTSACHDHAMITQVAVLCFARRCGGCGLPRRRTWERRCVQGCSLGGTSCAGSTHRLSSVAWVRPSRSSSRRAIFSCLTPVHPCRTTLRYKQIACATPAKHASSAAAHTAPQPKQTDGAMSAHAFLRRLVVA
jgi:hypothetical protein